jgi:hypothetical protein
MYGRVEDEIYLYWIHLEVTTTTQSSAGSVRTFLSETPTAYPISVVIQFI